MTPRRFHFATLAAACLAALVSLWLLDACGAGLPRWPGRLLLFGAAASLAAWAVARAREARGDGRRTRSRRLLLALLALAFLLHFAGLGHEVGGLYFADEGIYLSQAQRIDDGRLLRPWFIYPHLLFYADAFVLWVASLLGPAVPWLARFAFGVEGELPVAALVTRLVSAGFGALTVVPVYALARRLAGERAALLAGGLLALSPTYLEVSHLNISDVPSAFFATLALALAGRLLDRESARGYALFGLAAGLAAGSKYPAGLVAVAVAGPYLRWRRAPPSETGPRCPAGLAWAALAAILAFLAATPSLLAFPGAAFGGGPDLLFGARQYAGHGWPGVVRASNLAFYWHELSRSFGLPALLAGLLGVAAASRETRRRLAWLLPFPILYLALLLVLQMSVRRNLMPLLPIAAVVLAIGAAAWLETAGTRSPAGARRAFAAGLLLALFALPAWRSTTQLARYCRPSTRELAAAWMLARLPAGSAVIQESYTPQLPGPPRFFTRRPRLAIKLADEDLRRPRHDFLLLASDAYGRFLRPEAAEDPDLARPRARYQALFRDLAPVAVWKPDTLRDGPEIHLLRVDPDPPPFAASASPSSALALLSDAGMRRERASPIEFSAEGQWALFKSYLEPGSYRALASGELAPGAGILSIADRSGSQVARVLLRPEAPAEFELPGREKYFFYLRLPPGSRLTGMELTRISSRPVRRDGR